MTFPCPRPTALPALAAQGCAVHFDQIIRGFLQLKQASYTHDTADDLFDVSNWTTLFSSATATRVIKTPLFASLVLPPSEARFAGSADNNSIGGVPTYAGETSVTPTGVFIGLEAAVAESLRAYSQFSLPEVTGASLTIYLITREGNIICKANGGGIPILNFRVGSVGSQGYNARNENPFSFTLPEGWDADLVMFKKPSDATLDPLA